MYPLYSPSVCIYLFSETWGKGVEKKWLNSAVFTGSPIKLHWNGLYEQWTKEAELQRKKWNQVVVILCSGKGSNLFSSDLQLSSVSLLSACTVGPLICDFAFRSFVTCGPLPFESRWASSWGIVRRSTVSLMLSHSTRSFTSWQRHFIISQHHNMGESRTIRYFERERETTFT